MSLEIALRTHLLSKTSITSLVSQRVVFGDVRESVEALPHIAFRVDDSDWSGTLDGVAIDLQFPVIEFEVRAESAEQRNYFSYDCDAGYSKMNA